MSLPAPAFAFAVKAPEAFRSISEAATDLDLPQHVLRFWESRFPQLKPVKRAGGRRFYRPEDIDLLRGIRALLYGNGLTIKGVQKLLKDRGTRHVTEIGRGARYSAAAPLPPMPVPVAQRPRLQTVDMFPVAPEEAPREKPARKRAPSLVEEERVRLELLLAELLQLKAKLKSRSA